jgi:DNA-binding MarR family transcriptional regulator
MTMPTTLPAIPPPLPGSAEAAAFYDALAELVRVYQFRDRDRICCHDISVTQCYALEALADHGPLTLNELAGRLYLDKSTASRVVAALVRKGYARRGAHPEDRRAVQIEISANGRELHRRIRRELVEETGRLLAEVDPAVREGAVRLLRRLARMAAERCAPAGTCCAPACEPTTGKGA